MESSLSDPRSQLINHIRKFIQLDDTLGKEVTDHFELKQFNKKEMLLEAGTIPDCEFYVVSGSLRVYFIDKQGCEHTLTLCLEDWWAGDLGAFLFQKPADYYIQALEPTQVLTFDRKNWDELPLKYPEIGHYLRIAFQYAVVALHERVRKNISTTAEDRYIELQDKYPQFFQRFPQKYIASYLGMTPEFLSMLRRKTIS